MDHILYRGVYRNHTLEGRGEVDTPLVLQYALLTMTVQHFV